MEKINLNNENEKSNSIFTAKREIKHAFVTGATGLLGNNLVRVLVNRGIKVTGLVRNIKNAKKQFPDLEITFVEGNLNNQIAIKKLLKDAMDFFIQQLISRKRIKVEKITGRNFIIQM